MADEIRAASDGVRPAVNIANDSHYRVLGVSEDATVAAVKQAYKSLALQHHPDKGEPRQRSRFLPPPAAALPRIDKSSAM